MASWLKAKLFGRQLSYGSENEDPQSFEEAFQQQPMQMPPEMMQEQVDNSGSRSATWYLKALG